MLRKKEKQAIASIFALLVGWPIGLDRFVEGNSGKGLAVILGWIITATIFFGAEWCKKTQEPHGVRTRSPDCARSKTYYSMFFNLDLKLLKVGS